LNFARRADRVLALERGRLTENMPPSFSSELKV
jgi:hypothetical protein